MIVFLGAWKGGSHLPRKKLTDSLGNLFRRPRSETPEDAPAPGDAPTAEDEEGVRIYQPRAAAPEQPREADSTGEELPYASFVQEILEEYRSDSSPTRYAMAVELDDEGERLGPEKDAFPEEEPSLLHAFLNERPDAEPPLSDPVPEATALPEGQDSSLDWMDILREFRKDSDEAPQSAAAAARPMTQRETTPAEEPALPLAAEPILSETDGEDSLPAGIQLLTQRHSNAPDTWEPAAHLSVEDILAEYHGYAPAETVEEAPPAEPVPEAEASPAPAPTGRRSRLEDEARRLFKRAARPAPEPPTEEASETDDTPTESEDIPTNPYDSPVFDTDSDGFADETDTGETGEAVKEPNEAQEAEEAAVTQDSDETPPVKKRLLPGLFARFAPKKKAAADAPVPDEAVPEEAEGRKDTDAAPADYAPAGDYEAEEEIEKDFPSFGEYLVGLATSLWLRVRGLGPREHAGAETMEAEEEDLGAELTPAAASRYYGSYVRALRLRFRIGLILWVVMLYLTIGLPASGVLRRIDVCAGMLLGLQLGIMLLSLDVLTNAALNLVRARFGADFLAVLSCVLTSLDALSVLLMGFGSPHVPLCLLSSLSLLGVLYASYLSARGLRKSLRVPAIGKRAYSVTAEPEVTDKTITLVKSSRPPLGFVRRSEEAAPDETAYNRAAPALLILSLLMTVVLVLVKKSPSQFLFVLTALLAPAVPVTALLSYAMPFFVGSQRIFNSGAAIAGWSGLCDIGSSHNLIVTDRDLFPEEAVSIDSVRIFADIPSEEVVAYAGTMIAASGSGLAACFADLMERNGCRMRQVEEFEFLQGGGLTGTIDGRRILCGGTELMRLMNVRIPYRLIEKTTVLLAIDGVLYGIFNIKYEAQPTVKKALVGLMRSNRHAVFAVRDFNINPEMLHDTFELATDGYDFPPYTERFSISEAQPSKERKIAAVLCREGLGPLVHMADTGRSMYLAIRINLMISLLSSVFGVLAVFLQLLTRGFIAPGALLLYMLVWLVPVTLISLFLRL